MSLIVPAEPKSFLRLVVVVLISSAGCDFSSTDEGSGQGPGGREQPLALSPREELAVGQEAYQEVLKDYHGRVVPANHPDALRVKRVVGRLAKAADIEPLQREMHLRIRDYTFEWEVSVVQERQVNAFCLPAGKIVVFTGILPVAGTDDMLATVLSHEMAHALAHHGSERIARERSSGNPLSKLQYDRFQESEADHVGVFLMAFADFDADQSVVFWQRMRQMANGREPPEILSDHPSHEARIQNLRKWAPMAKAARRAFDEGRVIPAGR